MTNEVAYFVRPVVSEDFSSIYELARLHVAQGFLTLSADEQGLRDLIAQSLKSFNQKIGEKENARYLLVMEDLVKKQVIGTSLIIGRHGTIKKPHIFFVVDRDGFLELSFDFHGWTELGGLVLHPDYRGRPEKLGKCLSLSRLLFIHQNRSFFMDRFLAELLPVFDKSGHSLFWESFGKKWTGLSYHQADQLSRNDNSFIKKYFPDKKISLNCLNVDARSDFSKPGAATVAAAKVLCEVGFRYLSQVDPLDGGPHYGASWNEIHWDQIEYFLKSQKTVGVHF